MPNVIKKLRISGTEYDIHDARISGGVFNFRGFTTDETVQDNALVTQEVTPPYTEGDVVLKGNREFIIVKILDEEEQEELRWKEFGTPGGVDILTGLVSVVEDIDVTASPQSSSGTFTPSGTINSTPTQVSSSGTYTPQGTVSVVLPSTAGKLVTGIDSSSIGTVTNVSSNTFPIISSISSTNINQVSSNSNITSVNASISGEVLTLTPVTSSKISTSQQAVPSISTTNQTLVTGVTTGNQTVVTGITSSDEDIITGQPTTATFTGTSGTVNVSGDYDKATSFTGTAGTVQVTSANDLVTAVTPTTTNVLAPADEGSYTPSDIQELIADALSNVYKAAGSCTFENLPAPAESRLGQVFNITNNFTTTSDFVDGSGKECAAGTDVAIVNVGTNELPIYKYDVFAFGGGSSNVNWVVIPEEEQEE